MRGPVFSRSAALSKWQSANAVRSIAHFSFCASLSDNTSPQRARACCAIWTANALYGFPNGLFHLLVSFSCVVSNFTGLCARKDSRIPPVMGANSSPAIKPTPKPTKKPFMCVPAKSKA